MNVGAEELVEGCKEVSELLVVNQKGKRREAGSLKQLLKSSSCIQLDLFRSLI